jgi:hypothetical protein
VANGLNVTSQTKIIIFHFFEKQNVAKFLAKINKVMRMARIRPSFCKPIFFSRKEKFSNNKKIVTFSQNFLV